MFIGNMFAAIPQVVRYSLLGGFVLVVIVGLLKRII